MAFKMKRPLINGTPLHKASIAKAKTESIVAQTRTQADGGLVGAGEALGKSYIPAAIDFSIDQKAIKIPKSKKKKNKKDTNKKDVDVPPVVEGAVVVEDVPYVEEAEDKDVIEDAGQDNELDMSNISGGGVENRGYKNWKVREEERNIAEAEALKAGADAESRARASEVVKIEPKNIEQMPTTTLETKLEQAGPAPEAKPGKGKAHENPDYKAKGSTTNSEGQTTSLGGTPPKNPGYSYNEENDQWTYNDITVEPHEVPEAFVDAVDDEAEETRNISLSSNTPSNDSTSVDLLPQTQPVVEDKTTPPKARTREQKENDKIYNDFRTSKYKKKKMIEGGYNPIQSKSPMEMRDDRIYRNARADGPVRKNMIKGGYKPR